MRLATFNVENMFERPKAMNLATWADGAAILEDYKQLNQLIQAETYTKSIKTKLLKIMAKHKGLITNRRSQYLILREIRGNLVKKPRNGSPQIVAAGRPDWIGWFELVKEPVKEMAIENTARIIDLIKADILCVIEAENRITLKQFNNNVLSYLEFPLYDHIMVIDGNDDRGIDVGIMTKDPCEIIRMRSHIDAMDETGIIFSRDCAEYEVLTEEGNSLLVLLNHFKSKGYGSVAQSAAKRLRQATYVRNLYEERLAQGYKYIAVLGDLNASPDEAAMDPLIRMNSSLIDVMVHAKFESDGRPGTHGNGTASAKLDYILMSPELALAVERAGVERRGVWGGKNGSLFPHLPTIKEAKDAASDHAALWVDVAI